MARCRHQLLDGVIGVAELVDIALVHIGQHGDDEQFQVACAASFNGALDAAAAAVQGEEGNPESDRARYCLGECGCDVVVFVVQEDALVVRDQSRG